MASKRKNASLSKPEVKRPKSELGDFPSSFEDDLALLDSLENEKKESSAHSCNKKWMRPPVAKLDPKSDPLIFQQVEVDHYVGKYFNTYSECFVCLFTTKFTYSTV